MRKLMLFIATLLPLGAVASEVQLLPADTTIRVDGKHIVIKESDDRLKVKVFEVVEENDTVYNEQTFEGIYKNGVSHERRFRNSITIPLPKWRQKLSDPHWAGFGIGFANLTDGSLRLNSADGIDVRSGKSFQFNLNLIDHAFQISRTGWGVVTGVGFRWDVYRFDGNIRLQEVDGITQVLSAPDDIYYSTSRLKMTRLTIPLLLEWQKSLRHHSCFFLSGGIVAGAKIYSNSVVKYRDENGHKQKNVLGKDLNLRPITMDILLQAGYGSFGLYAMYSPFSLFEKDKGPKTCPIAIGAMIYF